MMWGFSFSLAILATWLGFVNCTFNLFMNQTVAKRVLGLNARVYFIRSGVIMKNAVKYNMRIPSTIKCLGFTWFRESASPVRYFLTINTLNPQLLNKPTINIDTKGEVPIKRKEFCIKIKCRDDSTTTSPMPTSTTPPMPTSTTPSRRQCNNSCTTGMVQMNMTFYALKTGILQISMNRLKTCTKVLPLAGLPLVSTDTPIQYKTRTDEKLAFSASEKTKVFYIAVGVACSVIFIIALAVAAIHVHSMPSANKDGNSYDGSIQGRANPKPIGKSGEDSTVHTTLLNQPAQVAVPTFQTGKVNYQQNSMPTNKQRTNHIPVKVQVNQPHPNNLAPPRTRYMPFHGGQGSYLGNGDIPSVTSRTQSVSSSIMVPHRNPSESSAHVESYPYAGGLTSTQRGNYGNRDIKTELTALDVDLDRITLGDLLYEGTFARIYEGVLTGPGGDEKKQQGVLVKTVSEIASLQQVNLMLIESSMLRDLTHKNLLPIMNVCLEDDNQPLVMFPFMNRGNLKLFLKKSRSSEGMSKVRSLTTADLLHVGIQIAKGMQYLARRKIVHKDLAARNCFLDDELNVKVTDCALSRDLFPNDYCCLCDNENRPVKWMAVESLEHNRYSVSSDVWSYGVLLWELLTLAQQPYSNIDAFEMLSFLKKGHRIAQPLNCPDELFTVIACCWALSEDERPNFGQLIVCLTEFNNALSNFV